MLLPWAPFWLNKVGQVPPNRRHHLLPSASGGGNLDGHDQEAAIPSKIDVG